MARPLPEALPLLAHPLSKLEALGLDTLVPRPLRTPRRLLDSSASSETRSSSAISRTMLRKPMSPSVSLSLLPTRHARHRTRLVDLLADSIIRCRAYSLRRLDRFEMLRSPTTPRASPRVSPPFNSPRLDTRPRPTSNTTTESSTKVGCSLSLFSSSPLCVPDASLRRTKSSSDRFVASESAQARIGRISLPNLVQAMPSSARRRRRKVDSRAVGSLASRATGRDQSLVEGGSL